MRRFEELPEEEKFALLTLLIEQGVLDLHLNVTDEGEEYIYGAFTYSCESAAGI